MKKLKLILGVFFLASAIGCSSDSDTVDPVDPVDPIVEAPSDLVVTITPAKLLVTVKPTAKNATSFDVFFGVAGEKAVNILPGAEAKFTYAAEGNYDIKVVAKNTSTKTIEKITKVTVSKLLAAPTPTLAADKVINLFSDAYTNPTVNFRTDWSGDSNPAKSVLKEITILGGKALEYSALSYVGIEPAAQINATAMTHFHIDVYSEDFTEFKVKLVDFGANGAFQGGDDKEHELVYATPKKGEWISYDIPLSDFAGLTTRANMAQIVLSSSPSGAAKIIVDNMYFYKGTVVPPATPGAAPAPTHLAANVYSLFSNTYTNNGVDTFKTVWSEGAVEDFTVDGNVMKKYFNLNYVGIETTGANQIDTDDLGMTHLRLDVWTSNSTEIKVKIVDWGADGGYDGGDDVEDVYILASPAKNTWINLDIPLASLPALTTRAHISQIIIVSAPTGTSTVYVDNIYFRK